MSIIHVGNENKFDISEISSNYYSYPTFYYSYPSWTKHGKACAWSHKPYLKPRRGSEVFCNLQPTACALYSFGGEFSQICIQQTLVSNSLARRQKLSRCSAFYVKLEKLWPLKGIAEESSNLLRVLNVPPTLEFFIFSPSFLLLVFNAVIQRKTVCEMLFIFSSLKLDLR